MHKWFFYVVCFVCVLFYFVLMLECHHVVGLLTYRALLKIPVNFLFLLLNNMHYSLICFFPCEMLLIPSAGWFGGFGFLGKHGNCHSLPSNP